MTDRQADSADPFPLAPGRKKHPCPDCRMCQWCSDTRCHVCRGQGPPEEHLSLTEQIELYERLNKEDFEKARKEAARDSQGGD